MATSAEDLRLRILGGTLPGAVIDDTDAAALRARILSAPSSPGTSAFQPFPIGGGKAFAHGIAEGFTDFLSIAGLDFEGVKPVTGGEKFAKGAGHLVGLIGAFIPFNYATGFAMRGMGLAPKVAQLGDGAAAIAAAQRSQAAHRFAQTTLAFGLQEFGAGEDPKEGLKRGAMGAAFAGGIEGLLLARRLRQIKRGPKVADIPEPTSVAGEGEYVVHPDLVTLHRDLNLAGTDDVQKIIDKLTQVADETKGFQEAAASLSTLYAPNGLSIISGLTDPARFAKFLQRENPWTKFYFRSTGITSRPRVPKKGEAWVATDGAPNTFEVLMHDTRYATRLERVAASDPRLKETVKFLGEGEAIPITDAYDLFLTDVPGEMLPTPRLFRLGRKQMQERGTQGKGATFFEHRTPSGEIEILIEAGGPEFAELGVLAHEYSHAFTSVWDTTLGRRRTGTLREVFGEIAPPAPSNFQRGLGGLLDEVDTLLGRTSSALGSTAFTHPEHTLIRQLKRAQEEVLTKGYNEGRQKIPLPKARQLARAQIRENPGYYYSDQELTAWMFELMMLDPTKARKLAPQALRVLAKKITDDSPRLTQLMSRKGNGFAEGMGLRWAEDTAGKKVWQVLAPVRMTEKQVRNWIAFGMIDGMEVRYGTAQETHIVLKTVAGKGKEKFLDKVQLQHAQSGRKFVVDRSKVTRPTFPRMALQTRLVGNHLESLMKKSQAWLGFVRGNTDGTFQRGVVDLKDYARAESFVAYMNANKAGVLQGRRIDQIKDMRNAVMEHVRDTGKGGLVLEEGGIITEVLPVSQKGITMGERLSESVGLTIDEVGTLPRSGGGTNIVRIIPTYRNRVTSILREHGAPEREIDWFVDISKRIGPQQYKGVLEDDIIRAHQMALDIANQQVKEAQLKSVFGIEINPLGHKAAEVGARVDETMSGKLRIRADDGSVIAKVATEREAEGLLAKIGPDESLAYLDDGFPASTEGMGPGLASPPRKPYESMPADWEATQFDLSRRRRWLHGWRTGVAKIITPMGSVMRSIEALGFGPAFTRIFEPTQLALKQLDNYIAAIEWRKLGGTTIIESAEAVDRTVAKMLPERRRLAVLLDEFMTREQLAAPGGFLERGASELEIGAVKAILERAELGAGRYSDEVLDYVLLNRLIETQLKNAEGMTTKILDLEGRVSRGVLDEKLLELTAPFKKMAGESSSREAIIEAMGLSTDERAMLSHVNTLMAQHMSPETPLNVFYVARMAGAEAESKGGIEAFKKLHGITSEELALVKHRAAILDSVFEEAGLNRVMLMKGNMPLVRKASELGLVIDDGLFGVDEMAGMKAWIGSRLKSGGINPHDFEPYVSMMRHVQNLGAAKYLDPIWKETKEFAAQITARDPRLGRVVSEYLEEVQGIGHDSFIRLSESINQMYSAITGGKRLPPDISERLINTMLKFGYQASIPFRPALVIRNAFQMQLSLPYLGPDAWSKGLRQSMTKEGMSMTIAGNAIDPNAYPLASSREAFGVASQGKFFAWMSEKYSPELAEAVVNAGHGWDDFMRRGLDWYRKPDDIGRAVAYLGTIEKMKPAWKVYNEAGGGLAAMSKLKNTMNTKWFGEVIDAEFERLVLAGQHNEAASFLGRQLADKTHFLYGHANHPAGWRHAAGRLFGQFGTFPAQYLDYALDAATTQTLKEAAGFWSYNAVMNYGVIAAGASVGLNLKTWAIMPSLQYTGGPYAEMAASVYNLIGGSDMEQRMALRNMMLFFPFELHKEQPFITFENIESAFVPLSYALGDWEDALGQHDLFRGLMTGFGFQYIPKETPTRR